MEKILEAQNRLLQCLSVTSSDPKDFVAALAVIYAGFENPAVQRMIDYVEVANYYVTEEVEPDDYEPVTEEWLLSIGFKCALSKRYMLTLGDLHICPPCGYLGWWCGIGNAANHEAKSYVPVNFDATRGQVRQLLKILKVV